MPRERARTLNARVELHYLWAPVDELFERAQQRRMEEPAITREQLERWANVIQVPTAGEVALYDQFWSNGPVRVSDQTGTGS
jgi:predicted kinase